MTTLSTCCMLYINLWCFLLFSLLYASFASKQNNETNSQKGHALPENVSNHSVVNCGSRKIAVYINSTMLQCYCATTAAIWQHFVLSSVICSNIATLFIAIAIAVIWHNHHNNNWKYRRYYIQRNIEKQ
jgi:hypothetical protein